MINSSRYITYDEFDETYLIDVHHFKGANSDLICDWLMVAWLIWLIWLIWRWKEWWREPTTISMACSDVAKHWKLSIEDGNGQNHTECAFVPGKNHFKAQYGLNIIYQFGRTCTIAMHWWWCCWCWWWWCGDHYSGDGEKLDGLVIRVDGPINQRNQIVCISLKFLNKVGMLRSLMPSMMVWW